MRDRRRVRAWQARHKAGGCVLWARGSSAQGSRRGAWVQSTHPTPFVGCVLGTHAKRVGRARGSCRCKASTLRGGGARGCKAPTPRLGYTLVELLLATLLTLLMMGVVVGVFGSIGQSVTDTRALIEVQNQLRSTANRLRQDLEEATAPMRPPLRPEAGQGYFEIIEGPNGLFWTPSSGSASPGWDVPVDSEAGAPDATAGDNDDVLMLTIRSRGEPFVGRFGNGTVESQEAEVAWFVRGRTLYRRVMLVAPGKFNAMDVNGDGVVTAVEAGLPLDANGNPESVFKWYDVSVRPALAQDKVTRGMIANTLGDLTKPEYRYAHQGPAFPTLAYWNAYPAPTFPYHPHWVANRRTNVLGLPLLAECSSPAFFAAWLRATTMPPDSTMPPGSTMPPVALNLRAGEVLDLWRNPHPWNETDPDTGVLRGLPSIYPNYPNPPDNYFLRLGEEVILNNVLEFDVKVYDPEAPVVYNSAGDAALVPGDPGYGAALANRNRWISRGAYVDLGYGYAIDPSLSVFSGLPGPPGRPYPFEPTYDTWSMHYENDGIDQDRNNRIDEGTNGFDDSPANTPGYGAVDDPLEQEAPPPYPHPLRGIKVTIRVFEPDTRQVRQISVIHEFLSK